MINQPWIGTDLNHDCGDHDDNDDDDGDDDNGDDDDDGDDDDNDDDYDVGDDSRPQLFSANSDIFFFKI